MSNAATTTTVGRYHEWTLGDRIRIARESSELSQARLAALTGIGRNTISRYEDADETDTVKDLYVRAIALATGFDFLWLKTGEIPSSTTPDQGGSPSACNDDAVILKFPSTAQVAA
jgi:transcriptional regulator with XRE-family HTH domain